MGHALPGPAGGPPEHTLVLVRMLVCLAGVLLLAQLSGLLGTERFAWEVAAAYFPPYGYVCLWALTLGVLLLLRARRALGVVAAGALVTLPYLGWAWHPSRKNGPGWSL